MTVTTTPKKWTTAELEELVVKVLATEAGIEAAKLRHDLEGKGDAMPIESLELFNVLVEFMKRTGMNIPKKVPPGTMRSVKRFAKFAAEEAKPK